MSELFVSIFNLSLTAGWIVLAVLLLRPFLRHMPKWIPCLLWGIVGLRLLLPFSLESVWSLIPSAEPLPQDIAVTQTPAINSGFAAVDQVVNPVISGSLAPSLEHSVNPMQVILDIAAYVWVAGIVLMLLYGLFSYLRLAHKVRPSVRYRENIYYCDNIDTPFILGVFRPRIYLPSGMREEQMDYVIQHEKAHLKRGDHFWKPLGFVLLAVYWFHPILWIAYVLLCRDIETACDEKVIKDMDNTAKKGYAETLVACSVHRRMILVCPLAFGEVSLKNRIKSVLYYKKPTVWIVVVSLIVCVVVAVCFLTNPKQDAKEPLGSEEESTEETTDGETTTEEETTEPNIIWGGRDPIPYFYSNFKENNDGRMITINVDNFEFGMVYHLSSCEEENGVYRNPTFVASFIREINDDENELNSGAYWLTLEAVDITDHPEITAEVLKRATWQLTDDLPDGDIRGVLVYNEIELYKIFIEGATVEAKDIVEDVLQEISDLLMILEY